MLHAPRPHRGVRHTGGRVLVLPRLSLVRRYRHRVESAPETALIAVNATAAEKLERRLERLGVPYERRDLMKLVLLHLSRKVDPSELFPDREFPCR
jgi:hypothetical protein